MASLAMEIGDGDDYLQLCPVEEDGDGDDYLQLSPVEEGGDGDDYLQLSPVDEDGADHQQLPPEQDDEEEDEDGGRVFSRELLHELRLSSLADIIPRVGIPCAPGDSEVVLAVAKVLKKVEAPSDESGDCPICLQDDDAAAWKSTPCGHRFHGRCVERWLQAKGSCPMCRRQVVKMPTVAATAADYQVLAEVYGQAFVASTFGGVAA
ncbi:hypothetical protein QYE76_027791 [Lolium multiflorum]|uniref:RING-type domain-containing protein n=1 Tax=Lolium multiflorum TaxID=4521 RepID=A0AAD8QJS1_LOLMU|nr:hypothetical protein QYE76_027791 [Lolium multiflorum]